MVRLSQCTHTDPLSPTGLCPSSHPAYSIPRSPYSEASGPSARVEYQGGWGWGLRLPGCIPQPQPRDGSRQHSSDSLDGPAEAISVLKSESESEVAQCPTLCDPVDCSLPGSSVHGILQAPTGVGCHFLLQGIFLTQGSNPCLPPGKPISVLTPP